MTPGPWTVIFLGTPEFACPSLTALHASGVVNIPLVVTQPDRPKGRGRIPSPPPIKELALSLGLPVWQPDSIKPRSVAEHLASFQPDLFVVVAFGQLLPPHLLAVPFKGAVNVHPSLLPAWRGPAPVNWAIISNERFTGVTTMLLDQGMDTGPMLLAKQVPIGPRITAGALEGHLSHLGADLLIETIQGLKDGTVIPRPQPAIAPCQGRLLTKADGRLAWSEDADLLAARIRGVDPWPGAWAIYRGQQVKIFGAWPGPGQGQPGEILMLDKDGLHVATGRGSVCLAELQISGKSRLTAAQFWHGQRLGPGELLG